MLLLLVFGLRPLVLVLMLVVSKSQVHGANTEEENQTVGWLFNLRNRRNLRIVFFLPLRWPGRAFQLAHRAASRKQDG